MPVHLVVWVGLLSSAEDAPPPVSYHRDVRPILQQHCQGCHQPAKQQGELKLTDHAGVMAGGESGPGVVAGKPEESWLVHSLIGEEMDLMPKGKDPLPAEQIDLIKRWIAEGATDDTPPSAVDPIDQDHPPVYEGMPLVTAIAFSKDGKWLAVGGYREIILHAADGSGIKQRLIGMSPRIEDLAFSPDGTMLAASGGSPGRFGEIQIWKIEDASLMMATQISHDTLFGIAWSHDQTMVSFGCPDNSCRAIKADSGEQVVKFDHHTDWVLGVVFSLDDKHMISVSRDRAVKLTQTDSGAFIDNVTSITPGALTGGLEAIDAHPLRNEVAVGGVDGVPKLYRIFRQQARQIGDDFNLIRPFEAIGGAIRDVEFSADGKFLAVAGGSMARVYEVDTGKTLSTVTFPGEVYAVAMTPDGSRFAAAGYDGVVKIVQVADGAVVKEFVPVPLDVAAAR